MLVTTESGSQYEIEADRIRRVNDRHTKRGDGDWQPLVSMLPNPPKPGYHMLLVMKSLARYGDDDIGTPPDLVDEVTTRRTSRVTSVDSGWLAPQPSIAPEGVTEL